MRQRKVLIALNLAAILAAGAWLYWPSGSSRFSQTDYSRIHGLKSKTEVYAVLGPPGDYRTRRDSSLPPRGRFSEILDHQNKVQPAYNLKDEGREEWYGDQGAIAVWFDPTGRRTFACYVAKDDATRPGPVALFLRRLLSPWITD